jgi:hypothetical protein
VGKVGALTETRQIRDDAQGDVSEFRGQRLETVVITAKAVNENCYLGSGDRAIRPVARPHICDGHFVVALCDAL